jgi:tRNA (mo5U34)-methyltransferase
VDAWIKEVLNAMQVDELRQRVAAIQWFHTIDLGNGVVTPGTDASPQKLQTIGMPADLTGKSVLDICAWNGFFSFEAERRGARRVLAVDYFCWSGPGWGTKAGFDLAREALGSKVEDREIDVLDVSPDNTGVFDLVLFLGVLYHMRHPLLVLEKVSAVTGGMLILETHVDLTIINRPAMAFYPGAELGGDGSNWCGPNEACVIAMLQDVGFRRVEVHSRTYQLVGLSLDPKSLGEIRSNRAVFHAWK